MTPDLELHAEDLNTRAHIVVARNAPFPAHLAGSLYIFDDLSKAELERQKRLAKTMGSILDDSAAVDVDAQTWVVADPSSRRFGESIPAEKVEDIISTGPHGLLPVDDDVLYVREMPSRDITSFVEARKEAASDLRTLGDPPRCSRASSTGASWWDSADAAIHFRWLAFQWA